MSYKWLLLSVAAVALGAGGSMFYTHWKNRHPAEVPRKGAAALVLNDNNDITISGKIRPQHITPVSADTDGDLDSFEADVGQDVFEGQVLARIGSSGLESAREMAESAVSSAQQQVSRAERAVADARLESSRADADQQRSRMAFDRIEKSYDHQKMLFGAGAASKQSFDRAEKEYQAARQDLDVMDKASRAGSEQLRAALNNLTAAQKLLDQKNQELDAAKDDMQSAEVRSPVDGTVVARTGEVGKPAVGELFEIATDMFALEVVLEPKPDVLARIKPQQPALVIIPDLQSAGIPGVVKEIKGTEVIVEFESTLAAVKPGMLADVRLKM